MLGQHTESAPSLWPGAHGLLSMRTEAFLRVRAAGPSREHLSRRVSPGDKSYEHGRSGFANGRAESEA